MKDVMLIDCLKCGQTFVQYKSLINKNITQGLMCPHCGKVHLPTDFLEAYMRKGLMGRRNPYDLEKGTFLSERKVVKGYRRIVL